MADFVYASDGKKLYIVRKYSPKLSPLKKRGTWVDAKMHNLNLNVSAAEVEAFLLCAAAGTWANYDEFYKTAREKHNANK